MAKNSIDHRIKTTRTGKVLRRAMALGHSRGNKSSVQMQRKKRSRNLSLSHLITKRGL
ncbi:hypothetical protein HY967_01805 [Candidatus Jorgensenbacteria bacterium]|nr:hypothetical protein [Candidatus Jorgensenbacteria bacterium]